MERTKENIKTSKGITLVSLVITVAVIIIVASTTIFTSYNRFEINNLNRMYNDIELLSSRVANYYLKYGTLPIVRDNENNAIEYGNPISIEANRNVNDNEIYYIIDLSALEDISLNYGMEGYENPNTTDDVYIINELSHSIYYVQGIELDGITYYTYENDINIVKDTIPPSKPEIKVISGIQSQSSEDTYITDVEIEIVPGKDNWSGVERTTYSINDEAEKDITTLENNIFKLTVNGEYTVKAKSYDVNENVSETTIGFIVTIPKVGE